MDNRRTSTAGTVSRGSVSRASGRVSTSALDCHYTYHHHHHHPYEVIEATTTGRISARRSTTHEVKLKRSSYFSDPHIINAVGRGSWRLRTFARVVRRTQNIYIKAVVYLMIFYTYVTPVVAFLQYSATSENTYLEHDEQRFDHLTVNLIMVLLYGIRDFALLVFAVGTVKKQLLVYSLLANVVVWLGSIAIWCRILTIKEWSSEQVYILSLAGLFSALQLNTFMLLNAALDPLVTNDQGRVFQRSDTVSCDILEEIILSLEHMELEHKKQLLQELKLADKIHKTGELNHETFFYFTNKIMMWFEIWSTQISKSEDGSKSKHDERDEIVLLIKRLNFSNLIQETDSQFVAMKENEDQNSENYGNDDFEDAVLDEATTKTVMDSLFRAIAFLIEGQKLRAFLFVLTIFAMAISMFLFFLFIGKIVDTGLEVYEGSLDGDDDIGSEKEFNLNMIYVGAAITPVNLVTYYISAALVSTLISNSKARLQRELTLRVLHCGSDFEDNYAPGDLGNAFAGSLSKVESLWVELQYNLIFPLASLVSALIFFAVLDLGYAMFTVAAFPIVFLLQQVLGTKATVASDRANESNAQAMGRFENIVHIRKASKLYQNQTFLEDSMDHQLQQTKNDNYWSLFWGNIFGAAFNTVASILLAVTVIVLGFALSTGKITAGEFFSLVNFVNSMVRPIEQLGLFGGRVALYSGAIQDIQRILNYDTTTTTTRDDTSNEDDNDHTIEKIEKPSAGTKPSSLDKELSSDEENNNNTKMVEKGIAPPVGTKQLSLEKELSFENLSFQYAPGLPLVLNGISASFAAGSYNCIFGPSGCGKSTLLAILEGFLKNYKGKVCFDGTELASVPDTCLRRNLGVVFQETYVFDGSIKDNISFGYNNADKGEKEEWPMDRIVQAAKDAHIHDFIVTLPQKYDTIIGSEAVISLSGGQMQRLCGLARALLRRPALLVLDEATSALDTISERAVVDTVLSLRKKGVTTVSVSHHPNTAQEADQILLLDNGVIVQSGTYSELIETGGIFADMVAAGGEGSWVGGNNIAPVVASTPPSPVVAATRPSAALSEVDDSVPLQSKENDTKPKNYEHQSAVPLNRNSFSSDESSIVDA